MRFYSKITLTSALFLSGVMTGTCLRGATENFRLALAITTAVMIASSFVTDLALKNAPEDRDKK